MSSLNDAIKQDISDAYQSLKANLPNFSDRFQQRKMIALVANALSGTQKPIAMIEGPTGTGKTLAYLLAAIPVAKHLDKKLVIASSTVGLQEQLINKDLPIIENYTDYKFEVQLAKGRGRYVCLVRLENLVSGGTQQNLLADEETALWNEPPDKRDILTIKQLFKNHKEQIWNGDKDSCKTNISNKLWSQINNNFHTCTGSKCPEYNRCVFYLERKKLGRADIIIANHDLVLSDIASGEAKVLPAIKDSLYVFDEAHNLPSKAINHFSASASVLGATKWLKVLPNAFKRKISGTNSKVIITLCEKLIIALQNLHASLAESNPKPTLKTDSEVRFSFGKPPANILQIGNEQIWDTLKLLHAKLNAALNLAKDNLDSDAKDLIVQEQQIAALSFLYSRLDNLYKLWFYMLKSDDNEQFPYARWLSFADNDNSDDFVLNVSPINASLQLQTNFWQQTIGCVLTSATLTALNSFARVQELIGLDATMAEFSRLSSPFELSKVSLNVPKMRTTPKQASLHTAEIIELLPDLLAHTHANLVLFSSYYQMQAVYDGLHNSLKVNIQLQGQTSIDNILTQHKKSIDDSKDSNLFGVSSFAEGLDLPGNLCEQVIIAKIPFAVPTSPREAAYAEWVESLGKNSFFSISVPDASMRLIQACGRLIRQEQDTGSITIFDTRLTDTGYGKSILAALPPYTLKN